MKYHLLTSFEDSKGRRYILLCSDDADGGAVIRDDSGALQPLMAPAQVKQCFILSSMRIALLLVGKVSNVVQFFVYQLKPP
jgi:hypothetical protein